MLAYWNVDDLATASQSASMSSAMNSDDNTPRVVPRRPIAMPRGEPQVEIARRRLQSLLGDVQHLLVVRLLVHRRVVPLEHFAQLVHEPGFHPVQLGRRVRGQPLVHLRQADLVVPRVVVDLDVVVRLPLLALVGVQQRVGLRGGFGGGLLGERGEGEQHGDLRKGRSG
jgi:hypothetical protein